ncbi:type II secretion system protein [Kineococcus sp. R86509]|uniref:type II secretion system protein n=1 Tax=Kineococcus sp. R86509 TaxID=3093851 RepID=UPI0036D2DA96
MLARIRKSMNEKDQGFTLIELLVVMIIIGILAAIAIPVFLNQRKKAVDTSVRSDLRTIATAEETYFTDQQKYAAIGGTAPALLVGTDTVKASSGNTFIIVGLSDATTKAAIDAGSGYCITGSNTKATSSFYYNSLSGGLTTTPCPA